MSKILFQIKIWILVKQFHIVSIGSNLKKYVCKMNILLYT